MIIIYGEGRGCPIAAESRDSRRVTSLVDLPSAPNSNLLKSQEFWPTLDPPHFFSTTEHTLWIIKVDSGDTFTYKNSKKADTRRYPFF